MLNKLKWIGTVCLMIATINRAIDSNITHNLDIIFSLIGSVVWSYVAFKIEDKALFVVNMFMVFALMAGIIVF